MPAQSYPYLAFNRGLLSRLGLSRLDIERGRLSAEVMTNWMPRVLGSMMLRPGLKYLGRPEDEGVTRLIPFVFSKTDRALLEFTPFQLRVWIDDALLLSPNTATTVTNGLLTTDLTGWTDDDGSGATSDWSGGMRLDGDGTNYAARYQQVTVAAGDVGVEHALRVNILNGPVLLRVGTTSAGDSYINETALATGSHSLRFTPAGNFYISFRSQLRRYVTVQSLWLETGAAPMVLPTLYGSNDLGKLRYDQSGDVVFIAREDRVQLRVERRSTRSWSIVQYLPEDGPFMVMNVTPTTMLPSNLHGNGTLTASTPIFRSTHAPSSTGAGALFRVASRGQYVQTSISAQNTFTDAIRVIGVDAQRIFTVGVDEDAGGSATFTLQRSLDSETGPWTDITSYTADTTVPYDDGLDNVIAWYRIGVKTGDYGSGTHTVALTYALGSITGICRVTSYVSSTVVNVEALKSFGDVVNASEDWSEGEWSDRRGWPSAVAFHEARLCWAGKGKVWLSATDAFDSFDDEIEGDSAPISRSIGTGPVDECNWLVSLERLVIGGAQAEMSVRSSSLDEPLTPTAFQIKPSSTQGSSDVDIVKIDRRALFVQAGSTRVYEMTMANDPNATDFGVIDLTQLIPEIGEPSIVRAFGQRQPDTRVHFIRSDGVAAVLIFDPTENTICWVNVTTGYPTQGSIEDVCVLPSTGTLADGPEDHVYYVVSRTINGTPIRSIEKWARESECQGGALNKQADSHVVYDGAATNTITGLSHLEGANVVVWADGRDVGTINSTSALWTQTYTVTSGQITLPSAVTQAVVGLPYKAQWKSSKLALAAALGVPLTKRKRVHGLGLVLADTHAQGLLFGRNFTNMDPLPLVRGEKTVDPDSVLTDAEDGAMGFPGEWMTDARICFEARAPRPCTLVAMVADTEVHEQR